MKSRKWLAIVLVLAMCISMFPAAAYAEEEEPALQEEIQNEEMPVPEDNTPEQVETVEEDVPPEEPEADPEPEFENIVEGSPDGISPVLPLENGDDPEEQLSAAEETITDVSAPEMTLIQEAEAAEEPDETTVETNDILAYPVLSMNVETAAVVSAGGAEAYFRFVPTETKTYRFCSASESDTFGILYDAEMNEIDTDDNGGEAENFCVVSELFSGITYVFGARYVNPDETGTFLVTLADVSAENTAEESASETDTPEQGFSDFTTEVKQSAMLNGTSGFSAAADGDDHFTVLYDNNVTMKVIATPGYSESTLHFEWYNPAGEHIFDDDDTCSPWVSSGGTFSCIVWEELNGERVNEKTVDFVVSIKNNFSAAPVVDGYPDENERLDFYTITVPLNAVVTLEAVAYSDIGVNYEWFDDESPFPNGETGSKYTTPPITKYREFCCCASDDDYNSAYLNFDIYVDNSFSAEAENSNPQVAPGESATLRVTASAASGSETLQYEWYRYDENWNPILIEGATNESYQTAPVRSQEQYYCRVTDPYGNWKDVDFYVSVDNSFSAEAEDGTIRVALGESATLRVIASAASGSETLQYEWYRYDENWNPILIEGATNESYQTAPVRSQEQYYCRVTDPYGNWKDVDFYVSVDNSFSAEAEDGTIQVAPGESATLRVIASAASGSDSLTYEWYDADWDPIEGATNESYQTEPVMYQQWYYCQVKDPYGNTRNVDFYVTVDNEFRADYASGDGGSLSVPAGEQAELKVEAFAKTGYLHYQWFDENGKIEGATADTYLTPAITSYQEFKCAISDDYGNGTWLYFHVHVDNGFSVRAVGETARYVAPGSKTTLEVTATANQGDLKYQWYVDYEEIPDATGRTFETPAIDSYKYYQCIVTDDYKNSNMIGFYIYVENGFSVKAIDRFGQESRNVTVYVPENGQTTLQVIATCTTGELTYQWYGDNQGADVSENHTPTLEIREVKNCQYYSCHVEDEFGNSGEVRFEVCVENGLNAYVKGTMQVYKEVFVEPGSDYTCEVDAKADQGEVSYSWSWNSDGEWHSQEGISSLTLQNIQRFTNVWCQVEDMFGNYKNVSFNINIQNHLRVYANNENSEFARVMVPLHGNAELSVRVEADNTENLKYEWYKTSKTEDYYDRTLVASGVDRYSAENMTGYTEYSCVVTDRYGNQATASYEVYGSDLNLSPNNLTLTVGQTGTISAAGNGALPIVWRSSDEEIAIVDNNGAVTGKKVGFATITATAGESLTDCQVFVQFSDVTNPGDFFYGPIYQMVSYGVIGGWADGTFHPVDPCNRAAVVTFLWRLAGRPEPSGMAAFTDMPGDNIEFQKAISWAAENEITTGFVDGTFRPWDNCNRAAIVTFLWRYAGRPEPSGMAAFTDMPGDNIDFQKAISWAAENGITTGWDDGTFRPWENCARLAVASFLCRYENLL